MKVIVTCGPSYEPLDQVRRLTNFSTGELGAHLAQNLVAAGFQVFCCRGTAATYPCRVPKATIIPFATNQDLQDRLEELAQQYEIAAVFHSAALCDFGIKTLCNQEGQKLGNGKISTRQGEITLTLRPTPKIIAKLRGYFPQALIIGWKFEVEGTPEDVLSKAKQQVTENQTDGCVINGPAYGQGLGFYAPGQTLVHLPDKHQLATFLTDKVRTQKVAAA